MAPTTGADDTVKFLIACIRFKNDDKIDWEKVAEHCEIVSKAAATKRYERILAKVAKDDEDKGKAVEDGTASSTKKVATPKTPKTTKAKGKKKNVASTPTTAKKRKIADVQQEEDAEDAAMEDASPEKKSIFGNGNDEA